MEALNQQLQNKMVRLNAVTRYLHTILGNISQGVIFIDFNGIVMTYNRAAKEIFEIDPLDILYNNFWLFFEDDSFGFSMKEALKEKKVPPITRAYFLLKNGEEKELEIHNSFTLEKKETDHLSHLEEHPDFLESSEGIILLIRDVTDIHRMQNLAALNNRMKELGEMAAMVAHEIRNPLGGINGLASLLERDLAGQPELQKMATYIIEGTQGLNQLVNSILNYTRPLVPQIESLDLVELLNDLTRLILAEKNNHESIEVVINSQQIPFIIPGDMQLLKSAFLNLAINAVQAMPSGGKLTFSIEKIKNQAIIKIADTGCGIPSENISKLFSPFFTTKAQGNGFGLAEVNKVILAHGGSIAASSLVNKGTTFTVKLPMNIYSNA